MHKDSLIKKIKEVLSDTSALEQDQPITSDFDLHPNYLKKTVRTLQMAAIVIPLICISQRYMVILTKRSLLLNLHAGQVAFPGGKVDGTDSSVLAAALREYNEEIGLSASNITILGKLATHETVTGFRVVPYVGVINEFEKIVKNDREVDEVFFVPLEYLIDPDRFSIRQTINYKTLRRYYVVPYGKYYIWGATARILKGLSDRVYLI